MTLSETAGIWASAAGLLALAVAWFTYFSAAKASRQRAYDGLMNTVTGIKKEMELMWHWTGRKGGDGYLQSKPDNEYVRENPDWQHPTRVIFSFPYPAIRNLTQSKYLNYLAEIIDDFVKLNYSVVRVYDYYNEYRKYVNMRPDLYDSVLSKVGRYWPPTAEHYDQRELNYTRMIFTHLSTIHKRLIGGRDAGDPICLYKALHKANETLESFEANKLKKPEPVPWWYWVLYVCSWMFVASALLLLLQWGGLVHLLSE